MRERRRFAAALRAVLLALIPLFLASAPSRAQDSTAAPSPNLERELTGLLIARGFENVGVSARPRAGAPEDVVVFYENRVYRYELVALGVVAALCAPRVGDGATLEIVTCTRGVPVQGVSARAREWRGFLDGSLSEGEFRRGLRVETGAAIGSPPEGGEGGPAARRENPSTWKLDLAPRPLMELQLGLADDPFRFGAWIAPEATLSPFSRFLLTAQARIRLVDEFDSGRLDVSPGRTTLSAASAFPGSWLGVASAGYFPGERYGVAFEAGRFLGAGDLELRLAGDVSGSLVFLPDAILYSRIKTWSGAATVVHRTRGLDVETALTGGRYQEGDWGGRLDVLRRFGETSVGFFAIKTEAGSVAGFRLELPLPVARLGPPARVRLATVPSFPWEYRESLLPIGRRLRLFDNLDRLRKGLSPNVVRNDVLAFRGALRYVPLGEVR